VHTGQEEDVVSAADSIGYPIVLKRVDDVHKSDKGGVALNLRDALQVRDALQTMLSSEREEGSRFPPILICEQISLHSMREFFVGFTRDDVFGPVVCFGSGGTMVEAVGDVAFALPPRSRQDTLDLMGQAKLAARRIAGGVRSEPPLDASVIADVVERCAALARAFPETAELDVNPLMVGLSQDGGETRVLAADVKFRLSG
jgi:acetyltransferase